RRIHSEVMFLSGDHLYASSLPGATEGQAILTALAAGVRRANASAPVEVVVNGEPYLAFASDLTGADNERPGQVVILRSLAGAGRLFQAISNRLVLLWSLSIAAALIFSYLMARRITRPIDTLMAGVEELGRGNDDYLVPTDAKGEIGALARSFDAMRSSLRRSQTALLRSERMATIGQMASSIVHDLRNPLATITTAAEVLNRDGLGRDRQQSLLESQLRASHRMNVMLGELLEFSRGSYKLDLKTLRLAEVLTRAASELTLQMERSGVTIRLEIEDRFFVEADEDRIRRVFENLLLNAVQAMPGGGEVIVRAALDRERDGFVRVDVIDTGSGIPTEIRERIFEPFVSFGKSGGTGLGLAIAHRIVESHGGELGFETSGGDSPTGSDFFVVLPVVTVERGR
ncbi:MAG: HAMP domain-containing sensor histidine kinase, partial [Acidobacteriota bacterium]